MSQKRRNILCTIYILCQASYGSKVGEGVASVRGKRSEGGQRAGGSRSFLKLLECVRSFLWRHSSQGHAQFYRIHKIPGVGWWSSLLPRVERKFVKQIKFLESDSGAAWRTRRGPRLLDTLVTKCIPKAILSDFSEKGLISEYSIFFWETSYFSEFDFFWETSVMSRFRISINLVQVRELTPYMLLRLTPYIVIPVLGLSLQDNYQGWGSWKRNYLLRNSQLITRGNNQIPRL